MKVLVAIKQVLDPAGMTVNRKAGKVFVNREGYIINPADKRALEAALRIKDGMDADVIAAAIGPARAADALREARALGADRAILISNPESPDEAVIVRALVALCNHVGGIDLVLTGDSAADTGAAIGPRLAEALNFAYLGSAVQCAIEGNVVRVVGRDAALQPLYAGHEADLPAVVAVTREGPAPRYAHGGDIIASYRDANTVETLTPADLGLSDSDLQPLAAERGQSFPPEREFGKQVSLEDVVGQIR